MEIFKDFKKQFSNYEKSITNINYDVNCVEDDLTEREKEILLLLLDDYIETGSPISSLYLVEKRNLKWSSATIRNVLADLNEKGYLFSLHRSSGKIPTAKGFRFYVKNLPVHIPMYQPTQEKQNIIQREFLKRKFEILDILESGCNVINILTNYIGVAIPPILEKTIVRHIELIDISNDEILLVILLRSGLTYTKLMYLDEKVSRHFFEQITKFLNENFSGMDLKEIYFILNKNDIIPKGEIHRYASIILKVLALYLKSIMDDSEVLISGIGKFVEEIQDRGDLNIDIPLIYEIKDIVKEILIKSIELDSIGVFIEGDRNPSLNGLSILSGSYKMGDNNIGSLGIIGPYRMNYKYSIQVIEYIRVMISSMITKISR